ncbi:hypothetical protein JW698_01355 [Candidatus Wolfebacteria bacterium]|nr:hypothetical protein [Candidatus Wolfebacteria bacterium]
MNLEWRIKDFENNWKYREKFDSALEKHAEFLRIFPFREKPWLIDKLSVEQIYNPHKDKNYFFYWIEHALKPLGHLYIGGARVYKNAIENIDVFKRLLKIVINESLPIADKIDAQWKEISGFGLDKHIAKKIIYCYYPEKIIPSYKTEDLEEFMSILGLTYKKYNKNYNSLSVGKKFELLNGLLLLFKNKYLKMKKWNNGEFGGFLYEYYPPSRITKSSKLN